MSDAGPLSGLVFLFCGGAKKPSYEGNNLTKEKLSAVVVESGGKISNRTRKQVALVQYGQSYTQVTHALVGNKQTNESLGPKRGVALLHERKVPFLTNEQFLALCEERNVKHKYLGLSCYFVLCVTLRH